MPKEILWEIGLPRNDQLLHSSDGRQEEMKKQIGISGDKKLVLFAPTFRMEVELAVSMYENREQSTTVGAYTDENVSMKVVRLIQSYTGIVNRMVWRES